MRMKELDTVLHSIILNNIENLAIMNALVSIIKGWVKEEGMDDEPEGVGQQDGSFIIDNIRYILHPTIDRYDVNIAFNKSMRHSLQIRLDHIESEYSDQECDILVHIDGVTLKVVIADQIVENVKSKSLGNVTYEVMRVSKKMLERGFFDDNETRINNVPKKDLYYSQEAIDILLNMGFSLSPNDKQTTKQVRCPKHDDTNPSCRISLFFLSPLSSTSSSTLQPTKRIRVEEREGGYSEDDETVTKNYTVDNKGRIWITFVVSFWCQSSHCKEKGWLTSKEVESMTGTRQLWAI